MTHPVDELLALYAGDDAQVLYDEAITERTHAEQCAWFARQARAEPALVVAALLHDVGHLILRDNRPIDVELTDNFHHDAAGAAHLAGYFGAAVSEPVRLHVEAKRYLCAVESDYFDGLSPSSVRSLAVQGGPMSTAECRAFESTPYFADAVALRRFDERGKDPDLLVDGFETYRELLISVAGGAPPTER